MNPEIVDKLREPMRLLAAHFSQDSVSAMDGWTDFAAVEVQGPGEVKFYLLHNDANSWIKVSDIRPMKVTRSVYGTPETLRTSVMDAYSSTSANQTKETSLTRTYEIVETSENHTDQDVGLEIGLELRQMIGYGGEIYGAHGETEITASVNTSFSKSWGYSNSKERTISTEIEIAPMTETQITVTTSVSDLRQKLEYWCNLGMTIEFQIFNYINVTVDTLSDLDTAWSGGGYKGLWKGVTSIDQMRADALMSVVPPDALHGFAVNSVDAHIEKEIDFNNAVTGGVILTSRDLTEDT